MARDVAGTVRGITLQQLRYFVEVAAEGSISAAADLLYVAQPIMSAALKDLERRVGRTLFVRSTRGVTLTEDGVEFSRLRAPEWSSNQNSWNSGTPGVGPLVDSWPSRLGISHSSSTPSSVW